MLPRAGRRASIVPPATTAIDPLEGPPQPPAAAQAPPPPAAAGAPTWLMDGPDAEPRPDDSAVPRSDIAGRGTALTPPNMVPRTTGPSPSHPTTTNAPTWLEDVPSRAVTPQPLSPAAIASHDTPPVAPLLVPALSTRATETPMMSARRDTDLPSNTKLPSVASNASQRSLTPTLHVAPPPYEDHSAVLAQLEKETQDINAAIEARTASIAALDNGSHPDCEGIVAASTKLDYVQKQLDAAATAAKMVTDGYSERQAALEARRALRVATMTAEIKDQVSTELSAKSEELDVLVQSIEGTVAGLRESVNASIGSIVNDSCGGGGEAHAINLLSQKLIGLLRDERSGLKMMARNALQDETRVVVADTAAERSAMLEQDRAGRARMVREHGDARQKQFNAFRVRAKEERQTSSDRLFGALKLRMDAFAKEGTQKSAAALKAHRERMQQEDERVHREAHQQVDKMLARQHGEVVDYEKACERSTVELQQRLHVLAAHEQRMHDTAEQSAKRLYSETVRQVGHGTADPLGHLSSLSSQEGMSVNHHAVGAVAASVKALHGEIEASLQAVSTASDRATTSEVARLVQERETVLKELRRHMDERKDRLSQEWLRLESMLSGLGCKAEAFEKSVRQGRATLTAAQSRLDQVRSAWESSGLKCLQSAFVSGSPLGDTLPLSSEALLNSILFDVSCKLRDVLKQSKQHAAHRSGFSTALSANEEVLAEKRQSVAKTTHEIFARFEQLAEASARVEMRESVLRSEAQDCAVAAQQLRQEESAFQAAVAMAKDVAERLRAASADAQYRREDAAARGRWWPHTLGGALQPRVRREESYRDQRSSGAVARGSDASLSESKYRHLYEDYGSYSSHHQPHGRARAHKGDAEGDPSFAASGVGGHSMSAAHFQSLVPLDSMDSTGADGAAGADNRSGQHDRSMRSRRTDASYGHQDGRAYQQHEGSSSSLSGRVEGRANGVPGEHLLLGGLAAPPTRLSSESGRSGDMGRRQSLPTPSTDSGGLPM